LIEKEAALGEQTPLAQKTRTVAGILRPWLMLALVCGAFSLHPAFLHTFWTRDYLPNILQQAATNIILAVGMTFVILTGGIDLSVGSVLALCGIALGLTLKGGVPSFLSALTVLPVGVLAGCCTARLFLARGSSTERAWGSGAVVALAVTGIGSLLFRRANVVGLPLPAGLLACVGVGVSCGLINGLATSFGKVPSFVVTLGMLTAARGLAVYATDGNSVSGLPPALGGLGQGLALVIIALAVVGSGAVLQSWMRPGRYFMSIGANEEATRLAGVDVPAYRTFAFVLSGLGAALAAIVLTAKFQLADTGAGNGAELNAIAAVVLGGTSLSGGRGSVVGSLIGALTIAVLNSGLVLVGIRDTLQGVIIGLVLVLAVMADRIRRK
jgi:ribose/xylose/arabinose/galactoside ABC-type transport system permease subunit